MTLYIGVFMPFQVLSTSIGIYTRGMKMFYDKDVGKRKNCKNDLK